MLHGEEIENWDTYEADCEVFDRVVERLRRGVPEGREMMAEEVRPFIRMAIFWRQAAWDISADKLARQAESMSIGEPG